MPFRGHPNTCGCDKHDWVKRERGREEGRLQNHPFSSSDLFHICVQDAFIARKQFVPAKGTHERFVSIGRKLGSMIILRVHDAYVRWNWPDS
jgi:hypothetical protein